MTQKINSQVLLGSHVSLKSPDYFLGSVREAILYDENCFMVYTGAPQNSIRISTSKFKIKEACKLMHENNILLKNVVVHAPYIINLGNLDNDKFEFSKKLLTLELKRTADLGANLLVLHPGAHLAYDLKDSLTHIVDGLNEVLSADNTKVIICIETMAGKGTELGKNFEEIAFILNNCQFEDRIGVCLDTCHLNDAGYDLSNYSDLISNIQKYFDLEKIKVIHLNDSKNFCSSHKDRHENIGKGTIGLKNLINFVKDPRFLNVPKILETPYVDGKAVYKEEINLLKNYLD